MLAATAATSPSRWSWTDAGQDVTHYQYRYKAGTGLDKRSGQERPPADRPGLHLHGDRPEPTAEYTFQVRAYILTPRPKTPAVDAAGGAGVEMKATPGTPAALGLH